ncbi:hypothetical protein G6F40_015171 [Rhizopus arrhizus]|nr:hypothetical protein G6F40_015171 [Rhizopus arrhizus]
MRIHLLMEALNAHPIAGVQELSPGVRRADRAPAGNRGRPGRRGHAESAHARGLPADGLRGFGHPGRRAALSGNRARQRPVAAEQCGHHPAHQRPGQPR